MTFTPNPRLGTDTQYLFDPDLERFLRDQLAAQPRNVVARLKLLELLYDNKDIDSFVAEAQAFAAAVPQHKQTPEWQRCLSMGRMLAPHHALFGGQMPGRQAGVVPAASTTLFGPAYRRFADDERYLIHLNRLSEGFDQAWGDPGFQARLDMELTYLARRPSPLIHARRLSQLVGGAQIYLKREDASPRDTHLSMVVAGQGLLAERIGRRVLVTGSVDGRNGVQTASIAARLGLRALVFMDAEAIERKAAHVFHMRQLGAEVRVAEQIPGVAVLPRDLALQHWAEQGSECMLIVGLEGAPQPFPRMNREFVAVIGRECQRQIRVAARRPVDLVVTRGGDTADALGLLPPFISEPQARLVCVEPPVELAPPVNRPNYSTAKQAPVAQAKVEGLEYPGVTREHNWLRSTGRVEYAASNLALARYGLRLLGSCEGILPSIHTAAALGWACQQAAQMRPDQAVVVMLAEDASKNLHEMRLLMHIETGRPPA